MLSFANTQQGFADDCRQMGISPELVNILSKITDHSHTSTNVLSSVSLIIKRGGGLMPSVEIHHNLTKATLAKVNVGYWECECDLIAGGYDLLEQCKLDDAELHKAQETINMLMSDCACTHCE